jgi:transporter family protein
MYLVFALLSAVFAALVAVFGKIGLGKVDTTLATAIRAVVMALLLVVAAVVLKKWDLSQISNKAYLYIFLAGLSGAFSWLFYFFALKLGPATSVAAIDRLSVVFVIIFAAMFLGESLTAKSIIGGLLIVLGAILLIK